MQSASLYPRPTMAQPTKLGQMIDQAIEELSQYTRTEQNRQQETTDQDVLLDFQVGEVHCLVFRVPEIIPEIMPEIMPETLPKTRLEIREVKKEQRMERIEMERLEKIEVKLEKVDVEKMGKEEINDLSPREREIAAMVAQGHANKTIAAELSISAWTINTYMRRIFAKLGVNTRAAMIARLAQDGYFR